METLALIHIPKTAGTSMIQAIRRMFGPENVFHAGKRAGTLVFQNNFDSIRGRAVYSGHIAYAVMNRNLPDARYYAVTRHPTDRAVSYYKHLHTTEEHPEFAQHSRFTLEDHLNWLRDNPVKLARNRQTHFVRGGLDRIDLYRVAELQLMLDEIAALYALPRAALPHLNARTMEVAMSDRERSMIETLYQPDFELWDLACVRAGERATLTSGSGETS
jgi:Sulfotransferase family